MAINESVKAESKPVNVAYDFPQPSSSRVRRKIIISLALVSEAQEMIILGFADELSILILVIMAKSFGDKAERAGIIENIKFEKNKKDVINRNISIILFF